MKISDRVSRWLDVIDVRVRVTSIIIAVLLAICGIGLVYVWNVNWNYYINVPKYAIACVGPGAPSFFHQEVVRFTTTGDTTLFYFKGDIWHPSLSVKNMVCMISKLSMQSVLVPSQPFPLIPVPYSEHN